MIDCQQMISHSRSVSISIASCIVCMLMGFGSVLSLFLEELWTFWVMLLNSLFRPCIKIWVCNFFLCGKQRYLLVVLHLVCVEYDFVSSRDDSFYLCHCTYMSFSLWSWLIENQLHVQFGWWLVNLSWA